MNLMLKLRSNTIYMAMEFAKVILYDQANNVDHTPHMNICHTAVCKTQ